MAAPRGVLGALRRVGLSSPVEGWHGTPYRLPAEPGHPLGRLRHTGVTRNEGGRAAGQGVYIGLDRAMAEGYRDPRGAFGPYLEALDDGGLSSLDLGARRLIEKEGEMGVRAALSKAMRGLQNASDPEIVDHYAKQADALQGVLASSNFATRRPGHVYKVAVDAPLEDFARWGDPVYVQNDRVQAAARALAPGGSPDLPFGAHYNDAARRDGLTRATEIVADHGIPGAMFNENLAFGARDNTALSIYDTDILRILQRYGIATLAAPALYGATRARENA